MATWHAALASSWIARQSGSTATSPDRTCSLVDGRLHAVIDFGRVAVGDPACDLTIAWTLFTGTSRRRSSATSTLDDATWARARGGHDGRR